MEYCKKETTYGIFFYGHYIPTHKPIKKNQLVCENHLSFFRDQEMKLNNILDKHHATGCISYCFTFQSLYLSVSQGKRVSKEIAGLSAICRKVTDDLYSIVNYTSDTQVKLSTFSLGLDILRLQQAREKDMKELPWHHRGMNKLNQKQLLDQELRRKGPSWERRSLTASQTTFMMKLKRYTQNWWEILLQNRNVAGVPHHSS